jgi:hypothetical protein
MGDIVIVDGSSLFIKSDDISAKTSMHVIPFKPCIFFRIFIAQRPKHGPSVVVVVVVVSFHDRKTTFFLSPTRPTTMRVFATYLCCCSYVAS